MDMEMLMEREEEVDKETVMEVEAGGDGDRFVTG